MASYTLEPMFDSHKSFYGKAVVETWGDCGQNATLYSYGTPVAGVGYYGEEFALVLFDEWDYSPTTLRHVKEFMRQYGFPCMTKGEIEQAANEEDGVLVIVRP